MFAAIRQTRPVNIYNIKNMDMERNARQNHFVGLQKMLGIISVASWLNIRNPYPRATQDGNTQPNVNKQ